MRAKSVCASTTRTRLGASGARTRGAVWTRFNNKLLVLRLGLALLRALDVVEALEGGGVWVGAAEGVEDEGEDVRGELGADGDVVAPGDGVALREEGEVRAGRWRAAVEGRVGVHGDLERVEALDGVAEGEDGGELRAELDGPQELVGVDHGDAAVVGEGDLAAEVAHAHDVEAEGVGGAGEVHEGDGVVDARLVGVL